MEKNFTDIDELLKLIDKEQEKYQTAISNDKPFEEVKKIYLGIKELQKQLHMLVRKADKELVELGALACACVLL